MKEKKSVLILGNGISRLQYVLDIAKYIALREGELWGSNYIYLEYGPFLDRVDGHKEVTEQAQLWKEIHGHEYRVITPEDYTDLPDSHRGNSGIFLIAQALADGYKDIILCGFDFGGKDVWTSNMEARPVTAGLQRKWASALKYFPDARRRIRFWPIRPGYDKLSRAYTPVFDITGRELRKTKAQLRALAGMEITVPEAATVTEETRDIYFYQMMMELGSDE